MAVKSRLLSADVNFMGVNRLQWVYVAHSAQYTNQLNDLVNQQPVPEGKRDVISVYDILRLHQAYSLVGKRRAKRVLK